MRVEDKLLDLQAKIAGRYKILDSAKPNMEGKYRGTEATLDYSNLLTRALLDKSLMDSIEKILNILKIAKSSNTDKSADLANSLRLALKHMASEDKYSADFIKRFIEVLKSTLSLRGQMKDVINRLPLSEQSKKFGEAKELMSKMESYEYLNRIYAEKGFLFFPLLNLGNLKKDILVFLYFEKKGEKQKGGKPFSFLVFVNTDNFNELRLWGKVDKKDLYLEIDTNDSAAKT
ncbi:MAG: hypothetical protein GF375_04300, partial [Candidatus Omnitrophica bacterium]|nr:hypothetical protein [Candidatus Omnitrophota bacterium]MBD3269266.1 hypothetical protein [Candidatus Omnitrophota bacterium]